MLHVYMNPESGRDYLRRLGERFELAQRRLPHLSDTELETVIKESALTDLDAKSFIMDFAFSAETRRRNIERWAAGRAITPASIEHAAAVISALPAYTTANPEALGAMRIEPARRFRVDVVVEDILSEIAARLPRKIDAYRYHQDRAYDTIAVPGIGEIKVTLDETGDGIFRTIGTVDSDLFRVWNCRDSGVKYIDRFIDISRPSEVEIKPNGTKVELYDDTSGIFVTRDGKRYTNSRVYTAEGRGYTSDYLRDDLHRTYDGPNPDAPSYREANKGWEEDKTVLSWRQTEEEMIAWLVENVLNPLREAPIPEYQAAEPPEQEPFPEGKVGPLYAFVDEEIIRKITLIKDNPSKAYPDERKATRPGMRLLPLGIPRRNAPEIVHDGFVWCGIGEIDEQTDLDEIKEIGLEYRWNDRPLNSQGVAVIKPQTATDIYVIDWQKWVDYRARTFTPTHDRLTDAEYAEMHTEVAETIVPITEYKGDYKKPIILIGRDVELDEIEAVFLPRE